MTDADILNEIQFAVLEPADSGATWPSGLWTTAEVLAYLNQGQNRLLRETLLLVGEESELPMAIGDSTVTLPTDWLRTIRVVWKTVDAITEEVTAIRPLHRSDSFAVDAGLSDAERTAPSVPMLYMDEESGTLTLTIVPPTSVAGVVDLFYIPMGDDLTLAPSALNVPDEMAWLLKYLVLGMMLGKDGRGRDDGRAAYANQRYEMGVEAIGMVMRGWAD